MELMEFLYRVMEELGNAGVPVVFKGAMVLNLAIRNNNPSKVERATRDIDGDWVGEFPTMKEIEKALQNAVNKVDSSLNVQVVRVFGERKSAGFKISNERGEKIASIDLSIRQNKEYKIRFSELEEAYGKMKGIKNKPDFIEVYNRVSDIVHMFEI